MLSENSTGKVDGANAAARLEMLRRQGGQSACGQLCPSAGSAHGGAQWSEWGSWGTVPLITLCPAVCSAPA